MSPARSGASAHAESALRGAGLRLTSQRAAVFDALATIPHSTVERLHDAVAHTVPGTALPTVHAVVGDLTRAGLVRRVSLPEAPSALYELDEQHDNHHHLQCVVCGRVEDVPCVVGKAPCLTPAAARGMRVLEAHVTFRAVCAECERTTLG